MFGRRGQSPSGTESVPRGCTEGRVLEGKVEGKLFPRRKQELGHQVRGQLLWHLGTGPGLGPGPAHGDAACCGVGKPGLARVGWPKWRGVSCSQIPDIFLSQSHQHWWQWRTKQILLSFSGGFFFFNFILIKNSERGKHLCFPVVILHSSFLSLSLFFLNFVSKHHFSKRINPYLNLIKL